MVTMTGPPVRKAVGALSPRCCTGTLERSSHPFGNLSLSLLFTSSDFPIFLQGSLNHGVCAECNNLQDNLKIVIIISGAGKSSHIYLDHNCIHVAHIPTGIRTTSEGNKLLLTLEILSTIPDSPVI